MEIVTYKRKNQKKNNMNGRKVRLMNRSPLYQNIRSYALQPLAQHVVPATSLKLTSTTGTVASATVVDPTTIVTSWATRFGALYEEYRIVGVRAQTNFFSSTNSGIIAAYWDEKTPFTTPTATIVQQRSTYKTSLSATDRPLRMNWVPKDLLDLEYTPILTGVSPVAICFYTDTAVFGSPNTSVGLAEVSLYLTIQFRGYQAPDA